MKEKLVVVGNGMAGIRAIEELLKLAPEKYDITVFGAEPHVNYNRILLSPVLAGEKKFADIVLNDDAWYADNGITLLKGKEVSVSIATTARSWPKTAPRPATIACCWRPAPTRFCCRCRARICRA